MGVVNQDNIIVKGHHSLRAGQAQAARQSPSRFPEAEEPLLQLQQLHQRRGGGRRGAEGQEPPPDLGTAGEAAGEQEHQGSGGREEVTITVMAQEDG